MTGNTYAYTRFCTDTSSSGGLMFSYAKTAKIISAALTSLVVTLLLLSTNGQAKTPNVPASIKRGDIPVTGTGLGRIAVQDLGYSTLKRSVAGVYLFISSDSDRGIRDFRSLRAFLSKRAGTPGYQEFARRLKSTRKRLERSQTGSSENILEELDEPLGIDRDRLNAISGSIIVVPTSEIRDSGYLYNKKQHPVQYYLGVSANTAQRLALAEINRRGIPVPTSGNELARAIKDSGYTVVNLKARRVGELGCPEVSVLIKPGTITTKLSCLPRDDFDDLYLSDDAVYEELEELTTYLGVSKRLASISSASQILELANKRSNSFIHADGVTSGRHALEDITVIGASANYETTAFRTRSAFTRDKKLVDRALIRAVMDRLGIGLEEMNKRLARVVQSPKN